MSTEIMASRVVRPSSFVFNAPPAIIPCLRRLMPINLSLKFLFSNNIRGRLRHSTWSYRDLVSCSVNSRSYSTQWLLKTVLEELNSSRSTSKKSRKSSRSSVQSIALATTEGTCSTSTESSVIQKGILLEFQKDSERTLLGVAMRPDGKRNWMVSDQNGVTCSVRPQQITYIVSGTTNFDPSQISDFLDTAKELLDHTLLQFAWEELLEKNQAVKAEDLAEIIYGRTNPLENYCAHVLLSQDEVYFSTREAKGYSSIYQPRPILQVEDLKQRKQAKKLHQQELEIFLSVLKSAKEKPFHAKPTKCSWQADEKTQFRIGSLVAFALDGCKSDEQTRAAAEILKGLGLPKTSSSAIKLLIDIGYFPVHVNLELMKFDVPTEHSQNALAAVDDIFKHQPPDLDVLIRKDLTSLKVYAIDVDEADELDDALSADQLPDGRIKVWIHVADPTRWVDHESVLNKEAKLRGTSLFLPTATYPMFPVKLAMEKMSLKQGNVCPAVTVAVVLNHDGSIAESSIENSSIIPTYMMTYDAASELLALNIKEEFELSLLSKAAAMRLKWRQEHGCIDTPTIEARIKVHNPDDPEPLINLYVQNQSGPAMRLVSEMMILCGEAIAAFGLKNNIPLPYRGQSQLKLPSSSLSYLPDGPLKNFTSVRSARPVSLDFTRPIPHGGLGVPGYVQFTSPIRRYVDLLAHYQVKAILRGQKPPFISAQLEGMMPMLTVKTRDAKRLYNSSLQYWFLEYLRRQPREKEYRAVILRFLKDKIASILFLEIGVQGTVDVYSGSKVGDEIYVNVEEANPRQDVLLLKERIKV